MLRIRTREQQMIKLENENKLLKAELYKAQANLDYISVMADIDIEEDEDEPETL